jgi:hypothetical protein
MELFTMIGKTVNEIKVNSIEVRQAHDGTFYGSVWLSKNGKNLGSLYSDYAKTVEEAIEKTMTKLNNRLQG